MPPITVASFYGPHTSKKRLPCEKHLDCLAPECAIILGDYNPVTHASLTTALRAPLWPWPIAKEIAGSLSDLLVPHQSSTAYTRVCRYAGTASHLDRAYGTRLFGALFQTSGAQVLDFLSVTGAQDHDLILIHTAPWIQPHSPQARCTLWNRRDVSRFRHLQLHCLPLPLPAILRTHTNSYVPSKLPAATLPVDARQSE